MKTIRRSLILQCPLLRLAVRSWLISLNLVMYDPKGSNGDCFRFQKNRLLVLSFLWRPSIALGTWIQVEWSYWWNFLRVLQTILEQVRSGFRQRSGNNQPLFLCRLDGLLIQIVGRLGHKPLGLCSQNIQGAKFFYIVQAYACYFAKEVLHVPSIPQSISVADLIAVCIMTCNLCSCFVRRNFGMRR